jgi:hypothetical protein
LYLLWIAYLSYTDNYPSYEAPMSSPNIGGKNDLHIPLSSSSKFLRISKAGIVTNITVSLSSIYSWNDLYFSPVASMTEVKCNNYWHF